MAKPTITALTHLWKEMFSLVGDIVKIGHDFKVGKSPFSNVSMPSPSLQKTCSSIHTVEPLRSYSDVKKVIDCFIDKRDYRDACMFVFGVCTGLRISDLCALRLSDVVESFDCDGAPTYREFIDILEQKTGKRTVSNVDEMLITEAMCFYASLYLKTINYCSPDQYFFVSRKGCGTKPLDVSQAYRAISSVASACCPDIHIGTHTMRKTFLNIANAIGSSSSVTGNGGNTALTDCQILARHSNVSTTLRYMNAAKSRVTSMRRAVSDFVLGRTAIKELCVEYTWDMDDDAPATTTYVFK